MSAATLVPCLKERLPTLVALMCTMMEADAIAVQRESIKASGMTRIE